MSLEPISRLLTRAMPPIFVPGQARVTPFGQPKQGSSNDARDENCAPDSDSRRAEREGAHRMRERLLTGAWAFAPAPTLRVPGRSRHPGGLRRALERRAGAPWGCVRVGARKTAPLPCAAYRSGVASIGKPMEPAPPCAVARASAALLALSVLPVLTAPRALRRSRSGRNASRDQS